MKKRILLAVLALAIAAGAQSLGGSTDQYVTVAAPKKLSVASGSPAALELDFRVKEGMHINSNTPRSEFLIPTKLRFMPPTDIVVGRIEYPAGEELSLSFSPKDKLSVYSGDFAIKAQVSASHGASTGPYTVHGELKYQACNDKACFPPKTLPFAFDIQVGKPVRAGGVTQTKPATTRQKNPPQSPHVHN
ncbi:MAG TPA: protein-disulfide reductase DsbD domain-containing protein [Terriglobales bacterium]|nr:protein-disulfide reductase DsbD domain-containing protein [Terriglobales bacterium]